MTTRCCRSRGGRHGGLRRCRGSRGGWSRGLGRSRRSGRGCGAAAGSEATGAQAEYKGPDRLEPVWLSVWPDPGSDRQKTTIGRWQACFFIRRESPEVRAGAAPVRAGTDDYTVGIAQEAVDAICADCIANQRNGEEPASHLDSPADRQCTDTEPAASVCQCRHSLLIASA